MISCPHYSREPGNRHNGKCALYLYGGRPYAGNCLACVKAGENNETFAKELFARAEKAHPENKPKLSGCCDPVT